MNKILTVAFIIFLGSLCPVFSQLLPQKPEDISPLLIGEKFPSVELLDPDSQPIKLNELIKKKKSIVIFYRGGWCPYCNEHLSDVAKMEDRLVALGYQIIAISPDAPQFLKPTEVKNSLSYKLLSDQKGTLIKSVGLAYKAPAYNEKNLIESQADKALQFLPVTSLFILSRDGEILFEHINPNFKNRISGYLLYSAAKVFAENKEN
jgi:peroxiredoxin